MDLLAATAASRSRPQQQFLTDETTRFFLGGRQCGKTSVAIAAALTVVASGNDCTLVAPIHEQALELRGKLHSYRNDRVERATQTDVEFQNGATVSVLNGQAYPKQADRETTLVVDEAQGLTEETLLSILDPAGPGEFHTMCGSSSPMGVDLELIAAYSRYDYVLAPTLTNPEVGPSDAVEINRKHAQSARDSVRDD